MISMMTTKKMRLLIVGAVAKSKEDNSPDISPEAFPFFPKQTIEAKIPLALSLVSDECI